MICLGFPSLLTVCKIVELVEAQSEADLLLSHMSEHLGLISPLLAML